MHSSTLVPPLSVREHSSVAFVVHHPTILLDEFVLQHVDRRAEGESVFEQTPEPLLPDYSVGPVWQYNLLDVNLMVVLNRKERTSEEFVEIGDRTGLRFIKL